MNFEEILALVLKQMGGKVLVEKQTFMNLNDNYEIMAMRNLDGNLVFELIEDDEQVTAIRANRATEQARTGRIIGSP